jgi:glycosyltransferase A (GT-A) superfamily protein (DUF2064 family)
VHALDAQASLTPSATLASHSLGRGRHESCDPVAHWLLAACALGHKGGRRLVRAALELAATTDGVDLRGQAAADAATVLAMGGERAEAEVQWGQAFELFEQKGNVVALRIARSRREGLMVAG